MPPKVITVILNYRNAPDTIECVRSIFKNSYPNHECILIDNASADGSAAILRKEFPHIPLIENTANLGYAGGNNIGIDCALHNGADYVFILNNDALLGAPETIGQLVDIGERDQKATIIAPRICYHNEPDRINSLGTSMDWLRLRPYQGLCGQIDQDPGRPLQNAVIIPGSALLLKKELIERVGKFNESYFLIHEDADLCYRNRKAGFKNIVLPQSTVYHKVSRTLSRYPFLSEYYSTRNFLYLAKTHATFLEKLSVMLGVLMFSIQRAFQFLFDSNRKDRALGFFIGVLDFLKNQTGAYRGV